MYGDKIPNTVVKTLYYYNPEQEYLEYQMGKCPNCGQKAKGDFCPWCDYPLRKRGWVRRKNGERHLKKLIRQSTNGSLNIEGIIKEATRMIKKEAEEESARIIAEQLARGIEEQAKKEAKERANREVEQIIREASLKAKKAADKESYKLIAEQVAQGIKAQAREEAKERAKKETERIIREAIPEETGKEPPTFVVEPEQSVEPAAQPMPLSSAPRDKYQNSRLRMPPEIQVAAKIRVFIVDRQIIFYEGLHLYLSQTQDIAVIGKSEDFAEDTVLMIENMESSVVLVDTNPPSFSGFELARRIAKHRPTTPVIMLTPYENDDQILEALKAGGAGYLGKDITPEELTDAIRQVFEGERIISKLLIKPRIAQRVLDQFQGMIKTGTSASSLSPEETQMLCYFANGYSIKQVSHIMAVSNEIIKDSLASITLKLIA